MLPACSHQRWQQPLTEPPQTLTPGLAAIPRGAPPDAHTRAGSSPRAPCRAPPDAHASAARARAAGSRDGHTLGSARLVWRVPGGTTQPPSSFSSSLSLLLVLRLCSSASHLDQYSKINLEVFFASSVLKSDICSTSFSRERQQHCTRRQSPHHPPRWSLLSGTSLSLAPKCSLFLSYLESHSKKGNPPLKTSGVPLSPLGPDISHHSLTHQKFLSDSAMPPQHPQSQLRTILLPQFASAHLSAGHASLQHPLSKWNDKAHTSSMSALRFFETGITG